MRQRRILLLYFVWVRWNEGMCQKRGFWGKKLCLKLAFKSICTSPNTSDFVTLRVWLINGFKCVFADCELSGFHSNVFNQRILKFFLLHQVRLKSVKIEIILVSLGQKKFQRFERKTSLHPATTFLLQKKWTSILIDCPWPDLLNEHR